MSIQDLLSTVKTYNSGVNLDKIKKAYEFAKSAHRGQKRKSGDSYISHPLAVTEILAELKVDDDTMCAALLHDVPEDCELKLKEIEKEFGKTVSFLVSGVTKLSKVYYMDRMVDRQVESLKKMFLMMTKDLRVVVIKLADRLHNMRTLQHIDPDKRLRIAKETEEIYVPLSRLLGIDRWRWQLADLCCKYLDPVEYEQIEIKYKEYMKEKKPLVEKMSEMVQKKFAKQGTNVKVEPLYRRISDLKKIMADRKIKLGEIEDLFAIRVVVPTERDCYCGIGIIHGLWNPLRKTFYDYVAVPKFNLYQSLHTTVFGLSGLATEFQLRTPLMNDVAKFGIVALWNHAKKGHKQFQNDQQWLSNILELQQEHHDNEAFITELKRDILFDRIFVFTPKGDVIDLPKGATSLDFAYEIHTDLGARCKKTIVNNKQVPLDRKLKTGDVIEIVTTDGSYVPDYDWLKFVVTKKAQSYIKNWFKNIKEDDKLEYGKQLLQKELDRFCQTTITRIPVKRRQTVQQKFECNSWNELLIGIGEGIIKPLEVLRNLYSEEELLKGTAKKESKITVGVECEDRVAMLSDLARAIAECGFNIKKVASKPFKKDKQGLAFTLTTESLEQLSNLIDMLEKISGVGKVYKK